MIWIRGIRLTNWRCFRGTTEIDLEPKCYSITATWEGDSGRSNWAGKSSIMEAVRFALSGWLRKHEKAQDWITTGEKAGSVEVELSNGWMIIREREGSHATNLTVQMDVEGEQQEFQGQAAQDRIDDLLKADDSLLSDTVFCEQKRAAQLVEATSGVLDQTLNSWFDLSKADDAIDHAKGRVKDTLREYNATSSRLTELAHRAKCELSMFEEIQFSESCDRKLDELKGLIDRKREQIAQQSSKTKVVAEYERAMREYSRNEMKRRDREAAEELVSQITEELGDLEPVDPIKVKKVEKAHTQALRAYVEANDEYGMCQSLARAEFDGVCPVNKGSCPIKSEINSESKTHRDRLAGLKTVLDATCEQKSKTLQQVRGLQATATVIERLESNLKHAKGRLESLQKHVNMVEPERPHVEIDSTLSEELAELLSEQRAVVNMKENYTQLREKMERKKVDLFHHKEALKVLDLARRAILQQVVHIERDANEGLQEAAIDLDVKFILESVQNKLEPVCMECGHEFGRSQAIKKCPQCEADRERVVKHKPSLNISDRSGGADELAGVFVKMAAAKHLRRTYAMPLATYFFDEVFGALDESNRHKLASHFVSQLSIRFGAAQALIIAHDVQTVEMTPGRINIHVAKNGDRTVEVT